MIQFKNLSTEKSILGEGISISSDSSCVAWVDILGNKVFTYFVSTKKLIVRETWQNPSCTFQDGSDWIYVAHDGGIDKFNKFSETHFHCVAWFDPLSNLRCNDGKMDSKGNIWISTMSKTNEVGRGEIWKWDQKNFPVRVKDKLTIPNSICMNEITGDFYYSDTPKNKIYIDSLDLKGIPNGSESVFYDGSGSNGLPDGSAIDSFGFLWNTRWDGSSIIRISPHGELTKIVNTPFSRPTSLVFGSSDKFFVTSAQSSNDVGQGFTYQASI